MSNAELHEAAQRMRAAAQGIAASELDLAAGEGSRAELARNMLQHCLRRVLVEELPRHGDAQDVGPRLAGLEQRLDRLTGILGDLLEGIGQQQEVASKALWRQCTLQGPARRKAARLPGSWVDPERHGLRRLWSSVR